VSVDDASSGLNSRALRTFPFKVRAEEIWKDRGEKSLGLQIGSHPPSPHPSTLRLIPIIPSERKEIFCPECATGVCGAGGRRIWDDADV
jgi:hypothetical protein